MMKPRFPVFWVGGLLAVVALCLLSPLCVGGGRAGITGILSDNCDGLVVVNRTAAFELINLRHGGGGATAEWPEGKWIIEWSLDQRTWMTPRTHPEHFGRDGSAARLLLGAKGLARTGPLTVYARASVEVDGRVVAGPAGFSHAVRIVGMSPIQYSGDGGGTWRPASGMLQFGIGQSVVYRVVPIGAELFPPCGVSWRYEAGRGPQWAGGEKVVIQYDMFSKSMHTPYVTNCYLARIRPGVAVANGGGGMGQAALARLRGAVRSGVRDCRALAGVVRESGAAELCRSASVSAREVLSILAGHLAGVVPGRVVHGVD